MIVKTCLHIVQHRQILKQTDVLEGPGNAGLVYFRGFPAGNVDSCQLNASCIRLIYACQQIENSGLTGSVGTDETVKLSFLLNFSAKRSRITTNWGAELNSMARISTIAYISIR